MHGSLAARMTYTRISHALALIASAVMATWATASAQSHVTIRGTVSDSATGKGLRLVTVRIVGTPKGPITTKDGAFVIRLTSASASSRDTSIRASSPDSVLRISASMVGYKPDTLTIPLRDTSLSIVLVEKPFNARVVDVIAEDTGERIMRKVIARKIRQQDWLKRYTYMLYTKFVAITDTSTASRSSGRGDTTVFAILESFSKGYVSRPDRYFNEIVQRRQTANIPASGNFVAFGTNVNAFDDEVEIVGEKIVTPFHRNAADYYDFVLTSSEDDSIVIIEATLKGIARKALIGTLYIDQRGSRPLEVRLTPNKAVNLPFDAALSYRQTFTEVDNANAAGNVAQSDKAVMPEALSLASTLQADILFIFSPRLDISIETFCDDYIIPATFDDDVFDRRRVEALESSQTFDSTYWNTNIKVPLRTEEAAAYDEIRIALENPDSLITTTFIDRYIGPVTRTLARLARRPFTGLEDIFRYNRVQGPMLGLGIRTRPDTAFELYGAAGYGFNDKHVAATLHGTYWFDDLQKWTADAQVYNRLNRRDDPNAVRTTAITYSTLFFGNDYGDYYYARGFELGASYGWGQLRFIRNEVYARPSSIRVFMRNEDQTTAQQHTTWSLFGRDRAVRQNPAIIDGILRSLGAELHLSYSPSRLISRNGMALYAEVSEPSIIASDFRFASVQWKGLLRFPTLPLWLMDLTASVGWSFGDVPPQRFFSLESSLSGIAIGSAFRGMRIKEFYGDRYATIALSHNFGEVIPGILRIPNVASFGIEFLLFGGVGWTQFSPRAFTHTATTLPTTDITRERVYYETGIGFNRILLFFRLDVNARFSQRDTPAFAITFTTASF